MVFYSLLLSIFFSAFGFASEPHFWWGVGHSAFQVEGEPADSDWRDWTKENGRIEDGTNADVATGFWKNPDQDFSYAKNLGAKMFRLSIAWERIEPSPGQFDEAALAKYEQIILKIRAQGLEPLVTLHHFALPTWLANKGGFTSKDFPDHFAQFSMHVIERLAVGPAKVEWWMTFNEPMVAVTCGYVLGLWPPGKKSALEGYKAAKGFANAHNQAIRQIRASPHLPKNLKISVAAHWRHIQAEGFGPLNSFVTEIGEYVMNRWFLDSIEADRLDYLGINYYGRNVIRLDWAPPFIQIDEGAGEASDLGWVLYPEGLGRVLREAFVHYKIPILISENGLADAADSRRPKFLEEHIDQVKIAIEGGIPVIGYLHWSLTDNFEWAFGLTPRFGLIEVDYQTGVKKPRPSYEFFKKIIEQNPKGF